jgi:hypothetical protein
MTQRLSISVLSLVTLLAATACSDGGMANKPVAPPGRPTSLGIIRGTVSGDSISAEFVPMGNAGAVNSAVSPAIYGGPSTVKVTGKFVSMVDNLVLKNRTWTFKVHMQNLLTNTIGSNYSDGNTNPPDTSGVFIAFTASPITVTNPVGCHSCVVNVPNYSGIGNFSTMNQKYFWYKDRPTAVQASPGSDTTSNDVWVFVAPFGTPFAGDTVHAFTFMLEVSAAWPSPADTAWAYSYNWKTDSLPDQFAKPRWKTPFTQINHYTTLGSETFSIGTDLVLTAATGASSIYLARNDSIDAPKSASVAVAGRLENAIAGAPIQAVFGIVVPGATGLQAVAGIYDNHVAFVHLDPVTGLWSEIAGTTFALNATLPHSYRIRKFGDLDLYILCVDGVSKKFVVPAQLDASAPDFATSTVFFGALGNSTSAAKLHLTSTNYSLGTDGGSC